MPLYLPFLGRLLLAGALVAIVGNSALVQAQDDDLFDDENPRAANADARLINANARLLVQQAQNFDQMDQWVFGRLGGSAGAHAKLDSALLLRIEAVDRVCRITEVQKNKLRLAGRGDIKRFFDKVEALKRKFQQGQNDPNANIWQEIQPLTIELNAGLFGDDSIYAKTIGRTLSPEQAARFQRQESERAAVRYHATIDWFISHLDKGLGMTEDQRRRFSELLASETHPPHQFGQGDYWYLMLQITRLPEAKVKPIFDEPQWRLLTHQFPQVKAMAQRLKLAGVVVDDK
jgi:hypothetical protein